MKLLDIAAEIAIEVGEETPVTAQDVSPFSRLALLFINETGRELVRRVDWHVLNNIQTFLGDAQDNFYPFAADYARLTKGQSITADGMPVRGSLSADEWNSLVRFPGQPRYFRSTASGVAFYPSADAGIPISVSYQSHDWVRQNGGTTTDRMTRDDDEAILPGPLLVRGAVWRWYRHGGRDFSDHMAEYESMLVDYADQEGGVRQP